MSLGVLMSPTVCMLDMANNLAKRNRLCFVKPESLMKP